MTIPDRRPSESAITPKPHQVTIVVPLYNPAPSAVENIRSMTTMAPVLAVDDGSQHDLVTTEIGSIDGVHVIRCPDNRGIAAALNTGIGHALANGADVVFTFDQDSTPGPSHVQRILEVLDEHQARCVAGPGIVGSQVISPGIAGAKGPVSVDSLYQSGMAIPAGVWTEVGPFDESLFIDCVDTDFVLRVRAAGHSAFAVPDLQMAHALGAGEEAFKRVRVGPFTPVATFHSADRRYYINRNSVRLVLRHARSEPRWAVISMRRLIGANLLAVTVEEHRWAKVWAVVRGTVDGLRGVGGKRPIDSRAGRVTRHSARKGS